MIDPEFASFLKNKYSIIPANDQDKIMDAIQNWILMTEIPTTPFKAILEQTARMIYRLFNFKEVSIGLRSEKDGLYRYAVLIGFTKIAEEAHKKAAFTFEDMTKSEKYPFVKLNKLTDFCIYAGDHDVVTYNRPTMVKMTRDAYEQFLEGDYFDINIYNPRRGLIAWIEVANTRDRRLPSKDTIRWLEIIASILGIVIHREMMEKRIL